MAHGTNLDRINGDENQKPSFTGITGAKADYEDETQEDTILASYV